MQNRRPAPLNVVPGDPEETTWALPEGAIARLGKGSVEQGDISAHQGRTETGADAPSHGR